MIKSGTPVVPVPVSADFIRDGQKYMESLMSEVDPFDYDHVPLRDAGTVRVKYKIASNLEPRRYELDDK